MGLLCDQSGSPRRRLTADQLHLYEHFLAVLAHA